MSLIVDTVLKEKFHSVGMCDRFSFAGIQFDAMATRKKLQDGSGKMVGASLCRHNCTSERGGYTCPSAVDENPGIDPKSLAPGSQIVEWVKIGAEGLRLARDRYMGEGHFDRHCNEFRMPDV